MWILQLNNMRDKSESRTALCCAATKEELKRFMAQEYEPWIDDSNEISNNNFGGSYSWSKIFRKGSFLEWFNPPSHDSYVDIGTEDDWAYDGRVRFNTLLNHLMKV